MIVDHFPETHMPGQQVWIHPGENPRLDGATVIASGFYRDDDIMSIMVLLPAVYRIPGAANYALFQVNLVDLVDDPDEPWLWNPDAEHRKGVPYAIQTFRNIVPTVRCWENEYGMDY